MSQQFKNHFSIQAEAYSRYRPTYPAALFEWLASQAPIHQQAWDCGTGNGQAALGLAKYFDSVIAVWSCDIFRIMPKIDQATDHFYSINRF